MNNTIISKMVDNFRSENKKIITKNPWKYFNHGRDYFDELKRTIWSQIKIHKSLLVNYDIASVLGCIYAEVSTGITNILLFKFNDEYQSNDFWNH